MLSVSFQPSLVDTPRASTRGFNQNPVTFTHPYRSLTTNVNFASEYAAVLDKIAVFLSTLLDPCIAAQCTRSTTFQSIRLPRSSLEKKRLRTKEMAYSLKRHDTSDKIETCMGSKNSISRTAPSPPCHFPTPADPLRSPNWCNMTGYLLSRISTSPIRVLVMCVWTPSVPCHEGPAPEPPAIVFFRRRFRLCTENGTKKSPRNSPSQLHYCHLCLFRQHQT